ncbi:phospholipase D-like protein [Glaciihabitans tibetensis]|uniref:Phospholipase D-like protein n=1 Tax=Glaciihabitans tibetensis TaxID=1266600 RepID=A0A2T0VA16_9MICO|nr:PLD nuclease N-terminal domain-containing protein [Glaciihabitans tibetensis]PRY67039.1 phospholipase D-like protein [Glaciihabitans tibetensis]
MARLLVVLVGVLVAFTVFALIDLLMTEKSRVRALNKPLWALVIIVLPALGGILWLALGKSRNGPSTVARSTAPDDDPAFLKGLGRDKEQDERIRRLEQELSELDDDSKSE